MSNMFGRVESNCRNAPYPCIIKQLTNEFRGKVIYGNVYLKQF